MLPRTEPMIDALATSISPAFTVRITMISSGALPNVAFSSAARRGPSCLACLLGRLAEHVGERGDRDAGGDEDRRRRGTRRPRSASAIDRERRRDAERDGVAAREATGLAVRCAHGHEGTLS